MAASGGRYKFLNGHQELTLDEFDSAIDGASTQDSNAMMTSASVCSWNGEGRGADVDEAFQVSVW